MAGSHHGEAANAERREERTTGRAGHAETDEDGCEIRARPPRESPGMLSEGAEGSLKGRQSRKRSLHDHDDEYDREPPCERASRSHKLVRYDDAPRRRRSRSISVRDYRRAGPPKRDSRDRSSSRDVGERSRKLIRYDGVPRRRRSRSVSVRDYRGAGPSKRASRDRSRLRVVGARSKRRSRENGSQHRRSRSTSCELPKNYDRVLRRRSNERYRRMERKRRYIHSSSSDDDHRVNFKHKKMYSRSPSVEYLRGSTKLDRRDKLDNTSCNTNENILSKFLDILKDMKGQSTSKLSVNNVLPEFDPMSKDQTILTWLTKVEECAEIYGWNEREIIHFALPKLTGVAKSWYQGLSTVLYSWSEWKRKLVESFPCRDDYAELLITMLAKKARYGESLEQYYYAKINLLNRCGIKGRKAVDCLLNGVEDRAVRVGAQAARFREPEEVLKYLKTVKIAVTREVGEKHDKQRQDKKIVGNSTNKRLDIPRKIVCHNCNEDGHKSFQCKKPVVNCSTCGKLGHLSAFCRFTRDNANNKNQKGSDTKEEKQVAELNLTNETNSKYVFDIMVNDKKLLCHVDLGSQCTLIREREAKELNLSFDTDKLPLMRGIGGHHVRPVGRAEASVTVQGIKENIEILIVEDHVLKHPVLLGHTFTELPNIIITKTPDQLVFEKADFNKLFLRVQGDVTVVPRELVTVPVITDDGFEGSAYVNGAVRGVENKEHYLFPGEYIFKGGLGRLIVFNMSDQNVVFRKNELLTRAKRNSEWKWTKDQEDAFNLLKEKLISRPILSLYDPKRETQLHTDACKYGVAGILLQKSDEGLVKPVSYFSRKTTPEEQRLHSFELETLAVIASLNRFRVYLLGIPFKILTDCNALRTTLTKRDLISRIARWWVQIQEYDCEIEYRPGTSMTHADALSRNPVDKARVEDHVLDVLTTDTEDWISTVQSYDDEVSRIKAILSDPESDKVADIVKNYKLKNDKVYRLIGDDEGSMRWVVPKGVRWQVVKMNHDDIGHFGFEKTLARIQQTFWFPKMRRFVKKYVTSCLECAHHKGATGKLPGELHPIKKIEIPFHTIHADHLGPFVRSKKGNVYLLVIIDSFTKFINIKPVRNTKTSTTVKVFRDHISYFGAPVRLITDQGTSFTSTAFKSFTKSVGIKHILNAVATPRANGQVERFNRTILDALSTKCHGKDDRCWDEFVPDVQIGLNTTVHKTTGKSPSELLFGTRIKSNSENVLSEVIDETLNVVPPENIEEVRREAGKRIEEQQAKDKKKFDAKRLPAVTHSIGDLVSVRREVPSDGKSKKLVVKYQGPYRIIKCLPNDRYVVEDTPLTRKKGKRRYENIVAVDKLKPWLCFDNKHDSVSSDSDGGENSNDS